MRIRIAFVVVALAVLAGTAKSGEVRNLYLKKLKAGVKEPARSGKARGSLKLEGRLESFHLPQDFRFNPAEDSLRVEVGGVTLFDGNEGGEWRRQGFRWWVNKCKGDEIWKVKIEFTRGEFVIRGKRLDLTEVGGPENLTVTFHVNDQAFSIGIDCRVKGSSWTWKAVTGGNGTNAGYNPPTYPDHPDDPGSPGSPPPTTNYRMLADGNTLNVNVPPPNYTPWSSEVAITSSTRWNQEWSKMFGSTPVPSVDFSKEQVLLIYERGRTFTQFSCVPNTQSMVVTYSIQLNSGGPRTYAYRAVAVSRNPSSVVFKRR